MLRPGDVSVLIPALNEETGISGLVRYLADLGAGEVIVADGGSTDRTVDLARAAGARLVHATGGRGPQLRAAADAATGSVLWIVHADASLPDAPWAAMAEPLERGNAGAFALHINHPARRYRIVEWGARLRNWMTGIPYGDQGVFLSRQLYDQAGGFEPIPIMEDIALGQAILGCGRRIEIVKTRIGTDPRRWARDGVVRRTLKNWSLAIRYQVLGVDPHQLAREYRPHSF